MNKGTTGKLHQFFDTLAKLVIINVLTLITSLGIVTIVPSFVAAVRTMMDVDESMDKNLYKRYFINFRDNFKRSFFVGITYTLIFGLFAFALIYYWILSGGEGVYETMWGTVASIGFYFSFFILLILILIGTHINLAINYFNFRFIDVFKFSFIITFKMLARTLIVFVCWVVSGFVLMLLTGVWFFFGLSLPVYASYILYKPIYEYLSNNKNAQKIEEE